MQKKSIFGLFLSGFIGLMTESLPAGLLPGISQSLHVDNSLAGQTVTIYALATAVAAIPIIQWTVRWSRKEVIQVALIIIIVANLLTAISTNFFITMIVRFIAGIGTAMIWPLLGGYAAALSTPEQQGKAIALSLAGNPVGLALGIPLGTALGNVFHWQIVFVIAAGLAVLNLLWNKKFLQSIQIHEEHQDIKIGETFHIKGFKAILIALATYMVAHNIVYTYVTTYLKNANLAHDVSWLLFTFGVAAVLSVVVIGTLIDRYARELTLLSAAGLLISMIMLSVLSTQVIFVFVAFFIWGLMFGSSASLFMHAAINVAGKAAHVAQAVVVVFFSGSISLGALTGGALISIIDVTVITWAAALLLVLSVMTMLMNKAAFSE